MHVCMEMLMSMCRYVYIYGVYICIYIYTLCLKTSMHDYPYADHIVFHVHVEKQKTAQKRTTLVQNLL